VYLSAEFLPDILKALMSIASTAKRKKEREESKERRK
jgi:hypothetical protein